MFPENKQKSSTDRVYLRSSSFEVLIFLDIIYSTILTEKQLMCLLNASEVYTGNNYLII